MKKMKEKLNKDVHGERFRIVKIVIQCYGTKIDIRKSQLIDNVSL